MKYLEEVAEWLYQHDYSNEGRDNRHFKDLHPGVKNVYLGDASIFIDLIRKIVQEDEK